MLGFGDPIGGLASGPNRLTFVASLGDQQPTSNTFTMNASVQPGDVCILSGRLFGETASNPTGFTELKHFSDADNGAMWVAYRVIQSGDAGATFNNPGGFSNYATLYVVVRPDVPFNTLVIPTFGIVNPTSGDPSDLVVPAAGTPSITVCYYQASAEVNPRGMSPAKTDEVHAGTATNIYFAWKIFNPEDTPSAVTCSMDDEGTLNTMMAGSIGFL